MSNRVMVDIRHFDDDVIVLYEDGYGKGFLSYEPSYFTTNFNKVEDLLSEVAAEQSMDGSFYVTPDDGEVVFEACSSIEVHGFDDEVHMFFKED